MLCGWVISTGLQVSESISKGADPAVPTMALIQEKLALSSLQLLRKADLLTALDQSDSAEVLKQAEELCKMAWVLKGEHAATFHLEDKVTQEGGAAAVFR